MIKEQNLKNEEFGKLTIISRIDDEKWLCKCSCGKETQVRVYDLESGNTHSCGCARKQEITDLTGRKIGKLTVIKFDKSTIRPWKTKKQKTIYSHYWLCKCDCGNIKSITHKCLTRRNATQSCGCIHKDMLAKRSTKPNAGFNKVYRNYIGRCKSYNIPFELNVDEFYNLTQQKCNYCGGEPLKISTSWSDKVKPFIYNGIDRIDSNLGYSKENCVPCCTHCNYAKGNMTIKEFNKWLQQAYNHLFGQK